jgi:hypothetical protein
MLGLDDELGHGAAWRVRDEITDNGEFGDMN